jgi:hypothetical protein
MFTYYLEVWCIHSNLMGTGLKDMTEKFPEFVVGLLSPKVRKPELNKNNSNLNSTSTRVSKEVLSSTRSVAFRKSVMQSRHY